MEELEDRIIKLETDLVEMKTKYEEELEMEKVTFHYCISRIHGNCEKRFIRVSYVMFCAIRYHLYNSKNVKNTHGGVLLLVSLQIYQK